MDNSCCPDYGKHAPKTSSNINASRKSETFKWDWIGRGKKVVLEEPEQSNPLSKGGGEAKNGK